MDKATDFEIFMKLNTAAKRTDVKLTYTNKLFFIRLLNLCTLEGEETKEGYKIRMSALELADKLDISSKMVIKSVDTLVACGAVKRYVTNKKLQESYDTILTPQFYEKE